MIPEEKLRSQQKLALTKRLQGIRDARGLQGMFSRGANIYKGGAPQAQAGGGPQFGPPTGNQNAKELASQFAQKQARPEMSIPTPVSPGYTFPGRGEVTGRPVGGGGSPQNNWKPPQYGVNDLEALKAQAARASGQQREQRLGRGQVRMQRMQRRAQGMERFQAAMQRRMQKR